MLEMPVTSLPGVGPRRQKSLAQLGLFTIGDVLVNFPRRYHDFSQVYKPIQAEAGLEGLFCGSLHGLTEKDIGGGRRLIHCQLGEGATIILAWFTATQGKRPPFLLQNLRHQNKIWVYGRVEDGRQGLVITNGQWYDKAPRRGLEPVYSLTAGITQKLRRSWSAHALHYCCELAECIPDSLRGSLLSREAALRAMHFPASWQEQEQARRRLVFEEFFLFRVRLGAARTTAGAVSHLPDGKLAEHYLQSLPFALTAGQLGALQQVRVDMESKQAMRRLLQGDVGSGKTVIAFYAAVKAAEMGNQAAIMVPTELLARQMYARAQAALEPLGLRAVLLSGQLTAGQQQSVLADLETGRAQVVVGTHALLTQAASFARLSLAVVDEQHRFGVQQRLTLQKKGAVDLLVMSATPIPRSLALTLYGDLDLTVIPDKPPQRRPVDTRLIHPRRRDEVYRFLRRRLSSGEQAYIVFPRIEETPNEELKALKAEIKELSAGPLAGFKIGVVHGGLGLDNAAALAAFASGELRVLAATSMVEIGLDVTNAVVMVIENAEQFGLAQLHQLRGRVGRSSRQGYCFMLADPKTPAAKKRLQILRTVHDGMKIAAADLALRGPGQLQGQLQSGNSGFRLVDLFRDHTLLPSAAEAARQITAADPTLVNNPQIRAEIARIEAEERRTLCGS